jgi:hypothetical protein
MSWFRVYPVKDTFITNKINDYLNEPTVRITGSNFGRCPSLQIFKLSGTYPGSAEEYSRILMKFDIAQLSQSIFVDKTIPSSSVSYSLKMFDMKHDSTTPSSYRIVCYPLSRSWDEGNGLDSDSYKDVGFANWMSATSTAGWTHSGSDFLSAGFGTGSCYFDYGDEDLECDITQIVGNWLTASIGQTTGITNDGLCMLLTESQENDGEEYKTKIFHGRETKFIEKMPYLQAVWDSDVVQDNGGNFAYNNASKLFFYNYVRGDLTDVNQPLWVRIRDHVDAVSSSYNVTLTASRYDTGIFTQSLNISNTASFSGTWYATWFSASTCYYTASFKPLVLTGTDSDTYDDYTASIVNLKRIYNQADQVRMKVQFKKKNYYSHVLHTASLDCDIQYIDKAYYKILNAENNEEIIPFATGSTKYTQISYNKDGNYFMLFMNNFIPGFQYKIKLMVDVNKDKKVLPEEFFFRVE